MARSRRSAAPAPPRKPAPAPAKPAAPASAPVAQPAPSGSMAGGLLGTVAEGMAWGTGTAIARHAVNSVVDSFSGSSKDAHEPAAPAPAAAAPIAAAPASSSACFNDQKAFMDCLTSNKNDISACQFYLDSLNICKQQQQPGAFM